MRLIFYDFEVFKYDWLVVCINPFDEQTTMIANDKDKLQAFYDEHKNDIWVGYNSRNYDVYILKSILLGFDPKEVNDFIISGGKGWQYSSLFNKIRLISYDCMNKFFGLKQLEAFMGNDIKETSVPFDIDRKLTALELAETVKYCTHDVEQTMQVFLHTKNEFDAQMALVSEFNLPMHYIGKTQAQLAAIILGAQKIDTFDEWEIRLPETRQMGKYQFVADWFLDKNNHTEDTNLDCTIAGVPHVVAWGGLHGAINKLSYVCKDDEYLVMADVDQLYPTIMIKYDLLSRAVKQPDKFKEILETSLRLKAEKKKKEREPYKRICNITYGTEGDQTNAMYDPLHRKLVCVFGQILIIDLIDKLDGFCKLIQSNTDGILLLIKKKDFERLDDVVYEWEQRTGLHMSFDLFEKIYQKDVNNYIAIEYDGSIKSKGAYVKKLSAIDYDLPIVNKAMVNFMVNGVPVEKTILECDDLKEFQKVVKVSKKYVCAEHNGKILNDKTFRVFASRDKSDGILYKIKLNEKATGINDATKAEKFANTPHHAFIENGDINNMKCPRELDKQYYIDLAKVRLQQYGVV